MQKNKKVAKYRRPVNINLGVIIFGVIFIYIIVMLFIFLHSSHLTGYEVKMGSLAVNNTYRGVAIRSESIMPADGAGYINYYAREDERVSVGQLIYSIDGSGKLADIIASNMQTDGSLTDEDMDELKTEIINFRSSYNDRNFENVYDFKYSVEGTVMKLANQNALKGLTSLSSDSVSDLVDMGHAAMSGIVVYNTDGLENLKPNDVNKDIFDESKHQKQQLVDNTLVSVSDNACKLVTSENWSIVIPVADKESSDIEDGKYIKVKFLKNGYESWAKATLLENSDGEYCELDFTNSMITFASDRYIDVELQTEERKGLKVPNSAIVEKEFYLIPEKFRTKASPSDSDGFLRQTYLDDGSSSTEFVAAGIYDIEDGELYIDTSVFNSGDVLIRPDSADTYTVSSKAKLTGVYNMNKGYADFTKINVLYSNKEYSIVESQTQYGLSVYDHIVLDGDGVKDDDFVYKNGIE